MRIDADVAVKFLCEMMKIPARLSLVLILRNISLTAFYIYVILKLRKSRKR